MTTHLAWVCPHDDCDQFGPYADRPERCINGHVAEARPGAGDRVTGIGMKSKRRRDWAEARRKCEEEPRCRVCGCAPVQAAHLVHRSVGGGMSADSIIPLCEAHHRQFDSHELDLTPHTTYAEQAEAVRVLGIERARRRITGER